MGTHYDSPWRAAARQRSSTRCMPLWLGMAGLGLCIAPGLAAQQASLASINRNAPRTDAVAIRAEPTPPRIDGKLDDAAWQDAPAFGDFVQKDPNQGEPATQPTEFKVVYTDAAIYIGVRAFDSNPEAIRSTT